MLNWIKGIFTKYDIGDEVEFTVTVDIAMADNCAWVRDPQYSQVMYGPFRRAGEKFRVRGKVSAVGSYIHVNYRNAMPGYNPKSFLAGSVNSFCCSPWSLTKINENLDKKV